MMGKREIELEERSALRRRGQARQNPHSTPAFDRDCSRSTQLRRRMKACGSDRLDDGRSLSFDRQHRRMVGTAEWADRTFDATGLARKTDHRTEVHQGGVVFARAGGWNKRGRGSPEMSTTGRRVDRVLPIRQARQNPRDIGIDDRLGKIEGKTGDRASGVATDPRQLRDSFGDQRGVLRQIFADELRAAAWRLRARA